MKHKISFTPLYQQVKSDLLNRIVKGEWTPGSFLPNEFALAEQYGVSQGTLRKALNELTTEKHVTRYQGKGTAVTVFDENSALFPFFQLTDRDGKRVIPTSYIIDTQIIPASKKIAQILQIDENTEIVRTERLRLLDGEVCLNETIYIAKHILPQSALTNLEFPHTLYEFYQENGIRVLRVTETIEAALPTPEDIKRLNIKKNHPILIFCRTTFGSHDVPIEYRESHLNSANHIYWSDMP